MVKNLRYPIILMICYCCLILSAQGQKQNLAPPNIKNLSDLPAPKTTKLTLNQHTGIGHFTTYDTDNGLALDNINMGQQSVLCDQFGNLWFATSGAGISKYDGETFTTFTIEHGLPTNDIATLFEDKNGNIWIGTIGSGLCLYDGTTFRTFNAKDGLTDKSIFGIIEDDDGAIWISSYGDGVFKILTSPLDDSQTLKVKQYTHDNGLSNNSIFSTIKDNNGDLWFGGWGGGASKFEPQKEAQNDSLLFTTLTKENGLVNNIITSMAVDAEGYLWFGTVRGACKYVPEKAKSSSDLFEVYTVKDGLSVNYIYGMNSDSKGNLWLGTFRGGVNKYHPNATPAFTAYKTENGLAGNTIFNITEDALGNLWFGTHTGGVSKYNGNAIKNFTKSQALTQHDIWCITQDKDENYWFGTSVEGAIKYDGTTLTYFTKEQGLYDNYIYSIFEDSQGNLWFGSGERGISKFDGEAFTNYALEQGFSGYDVWDIMEDSSGNIWFASYGDGISMFDGKSFTKYSTDRSLPDIYATSILEDSNGTIWVGTYSGGISKFLPENAAKKEAPAFKNYSIPDGLNHNFVVNMLEDRKKRLWISTYGGGINIVENPQADPPIFKSLTVLDGLPNNNISALKEDKHGNILIGTVHGLAIIRDGDLNNPIEVYNQFTGYPIRDINGGPVNGAMYCDTNDLLWIGTGSAKSGLVQFDYLNIPQPQHELKVVLNTITLNNQKVCWYDLASNQNLDIPNNTLEQQEIRVYQKPLTNEARKEIKDAYKNVHFSSISRFTAIPQNLELPYKFNDISFQFNAIETDKNNLIKYQYKLEGLNEDWSPVTAKKEATFTNLNEGEYLLLIKAQRPNGTWSEPLSYAFTINAPWYRTWWAFTLYGLLLLLTIKIIISARTKTLKQAKISLQQKVDQATTAIRQHEQQLLTTNAELAEKNKALAQKNEEKKAMLKEIHHRVKNNLQVVNSLLKLQSRDLDDEKTVAMFKEAQKRVLSMALLHEKMYRSDDLQYIDVQDHITLLVEDLVNTYAVGKTIATKINIEDVQIGIRTLVPLGLLINEIITNALKHGFKDLDQGEISIHLQQEEGLRHKLIIGDNGVGLQREATSSGIGKKLIDAFTRQINGSIEQLQQEGTVFEIIFNTFPNDTLPQSA